MSAIWPPHQSERKIDMVAEETNEKAFSLETMEQDFIFEPLRKNN